MKFHKFISTVLHPIVMPTIGVLLYLIFIPVQYSKQQQITLFSIIFISTYIIPLLLLLFLKSIGLINDFRVHSIKERKIPLFVMIILFLGLGKTFSSIEITKDLSYLFIGTAISLVLVYFIFITKTKTSLHMLSIGSSVGFFSMIQHIYNVSNLWLIVSLLLLSGLLGTSRLYLKAHTPKEVYLGFMIGFTIQILIHNYKI